MTSSLVGSEMCIRDSYKVAAAYKFDGNSNNHHEYKTIIANSIELNKLPGVTPTNAKETEHYTEQRSMPTMYQPYHFLKQRKTRWGSAAD
eukprot:2900069-Prorocentrum_lima.AAC.1